VKQRWTRDEKTGGNPVKKTLVGENTVKNANKSEKKRSHISSDEKRAKNSGARRTNVMLRFVHFFHGHYWLPENMFHGVFTTRSG